MSLYPIPIALFQPVVQDAPPVAGQSLWLDVRRAGALWQDTGRTVAAATSGLVASWYDPSSGLAATQSSSPSRPLNVGTGLEFDGSDDRMLIASGLGITGSSGVTIICVASARSADCALWNLSRNNPGTLNSGLGVTRAVGTLYARANTNANDIVQANDSAVSAMRVVTYRHSPAARRLWLNATVAGNNANAGVDVGTQQTAILGMWFGNIYALSGEMRMVLVYPSALSDEQVASLINWAAARHGV